jgi:hypothetical protein
MMKIREMENNDRRDDVQEFAAFLAAEPVVPGRGTDEAILRRVRKATRPALWHVLGKLTLVQGAAGTATLAICPQFAIGFRPHSELLHLLHIWAGPVLHYLFCGIFFVIFGAVLGGLILNRAERKVLENKRNLYFLAYGLAAYSIFFALGAEALLFGILLWIGGVVLGNLLGFAMGARLRAVLL